MDNAMMELALRRAGFGSLEKWREKTGGSAAVADMALMPYLVGYELYRVRAGDTLTKIAGLYGTTVESIETANPDVQPRRLEIGRILVVPLGFSVVPEDVPMSWGLMRYAIRGLEARYPALSEQVIGQTEYGGAYIACRWARGQDGCITMRPTMPMSGSPPRRCWRAWSGY